MAPLLEDYNFELHEASHPKPDDSCVAAAQALKTYIKNLRKSNSKPILHLLLISGGASSVLTSPIPPLNLSDLKTLNLWLLSNGKTISEMNCVRKKTDSFKGGGLIPELLNDREGDKAVALVISDVVGDD
jgi:hydroxypyruvate reductase